MGSNFEGKLEDNNDYVLSLCLEKEQCKNLAKFAEENLKEKCDCLELNMFNGGINIYFYVKFGDKHIHLDGADIDCM